MTGRLACALAALLATLPLALPAAENTLRPLLLWRYNTGSPVTAPPACDGTLIAFTTRSGSITLLDTDGRLLRTLTALDGTNGPATFDAPPVFACDRIVVASRRGWVTALTTNGATAWQYNCGEELHAAPLVEPDGPASRLFVLTQASGIVHCLQAQTGRRLWVSGKTDRCDGSPALTAGMIVFGNCEAALHTLEVASGQAPGRLDLCEDCQIAAGIAADGPLVYFGTRSGAVYCADLRRRTVVWTNSASRAETFTTPALNSQLIVIGSFDGSLYALDRASGALVWTFTTPGTPGNPVFHGEDIFFGDRGTLRAISATFGKERWSVAISDEIETPVVAGDRLLVAGDDGSVSAYRIPPARVSTAGTP